MRDYRFSMSGRTMITMLILVCVCVTVVTSCGRPGKGGVGDDIAAFKPPRPKPTGSPIHGKVKPVPGKEWLIAKPIKKTNVCLFLKVTTFKNA